MKAQSNDPTIAALLRNHPLIEFSEGDSALTFGNGRSVVVGEAEIGGLPELMDNNPLVCAQSAWAPSPEGTLALIALGPIIEAGLVVEDPAIILSFEGDGHEILRALDTVQWSGEITLQCENHDLGSVRGIYALAKIATPENLDEIDEIYAERYSRSFFVREATEEDWKTELVAGQPFAAYRLEITEGQPHSILSIHVMGDVNGKLGAAQMVHMMNIMSGLEESIGIL